MRIITTAQWKATMNMLDAKKNIIVALRKEKKALELLIIFQDKLINDSEAQIGIKDSVIRGLQSKIQKLERLSPE